MPDVAPRSVKQDAAESAVESVEADLGPFVVAAQATRMPMAFTDACRDGHPIIYANDSFARLTGYSNAETLGKPVNFMLADCDDPASIEAIEAAFRDDDGGDPEIRYRRADGSPFWASVSISPVRDEAGTVIQHFSSFIDVTGHREHAAQSRMLIDELNHRVKNTLATVQSIVAQALRHATGSAAIKEAIESRLFALSRSHDLLTLQKWEGTQLGVLIGRALEPFCAEGNRAARCLISGADVRLGPKQTLALGIALHELATNAVKHGAFSTKEGAVHVTWVIEKAPTGTRLILRWSEKDGPAVAAPTRRGFGSQVIERGLAYELGGVVNLDYRPDGVECRIDIPL